MNSGPMAFEPGNGKFQKSTAYHSTFADSRHSSARAGELKIQKTQLRASVGDVDDHRMRTIPDVDRGADSV